MILEDRSLAMHLPDSVLELVELVVVEVALVVAVVIVPWI
jgi:hypothetical protein